MEEDFLLLEGYIARWKKYSKDKVKIRVANWPHKRNLLDPSKELLSDWKEKKIDWAEYGKRFRNEILGNPKAVAKLKKIKELAKTKDVRLICYERRDPCHRFILMEIIRELK